MICRSHDHDITSSKLKFSFKELCSTSELFSENTMVLALFLALFSSLALQQAIKKRLLAFSKPITEL